MNIRFDNFNYINLNLNLMFIKIINNKTYVRESFLQIMFIKVINVRFIKIINNVYKRIKTIKKTFVSYYQLR